MRYRGLTCQDGPRNYFRRMADRRILLNKKSTEFQRQIRIESQSCRLSCVGKIKSLL